MTEVERNVIDADTIKQMVYSCGIFQGGVRGGVL